MKTKIWNHEWLWYYLISKTFKKNIGAPWRYRLSLCLPCQHPMLVPVRVWPVPLLIHLPSNVSGKAADYPSAQAPYPCRKP